MMGWQVGVFWRPGMQNWGARAKKQASCVKSYGGTATSYIIADVRSTDPYVGRKRVQLARSYQGNLWEYDSTF